MTRTRKTGIILLIVGGLFAAWTFGAGLIAIWFVTLLFVLVPGVILTAIGKEKKKEIGK